MDTTEIDNYNEQTGSNFKLFDQYTYKPTKENPFDDMETCCAFRDMGFSLDDIVRMYVMFDEML